MSEQSSVDDKAEQMMAAIRQRYGNRLDEQELEEVGEAAKAIVQASEDMRAVRLEHGDSPFSVPPFSRE